MRRIYFFAILVIFITISFIIGMKTGSAFPPEAIFNGLFETSAEEVEEEPAPEPEEEEFIPDIRTVRLVSTGNIMAHIPQITQAHIGDGKYDFTPSFEVIKPYLKAGDFTVADLEGMQAGPDIVSSGWGIKGYTGFPEFNAPNELSEALVDAGVNIFTFANNHGMDRGVEGLMITLDHVHSLGAKTFGAYKSQEERDEPVILEHDGIKVAFIGYTYSTNEIPIPEGYEYCLNFVRDFSDITPVIDDIEKARLYGADFIAVFTHWGAAEHAHEPQPQRLREVAADLAAAGADLIIGGHPKFIQPAEWFFNPNADGSERATFVIYSQGNFISNQGENDGYNTIYNEFGLLLNIELSKSFDTGQTWISDVDYEITWVHRDWRHRVLPLSAVFESSPEDYNLSESRVNRLKSIYDFSNEVVERYGHLEDKVRAMDISEMLFNEASGGN
ncbi:MAG: CapA family protein [Bacillota bacterium]|nr:CapA family protein [Bacillota bacterium]